MKKLFAYLYLAAAFGMFGYAWVATDRLAAQGIFCEERFWMIAGSNKPACSPEIVFAGSAGTILIGLGFLFFLALLIFGSRTRR